MPKAKTVWLYRDALAQAGKVEELFGLFDGHLNRQGYIARAFGEWLQEQRLRVSAKSRLGEKLGYIHKA